MFDIYNFVLNSNCAGLIWCTSLPIRGWTWWCWVWSVRALSGVIRSWPSKSPGIYSPRIRQVASVRISCRSTCSEDAITDCQVYMHAIHWSNIYNPGSGRIEIRDLFYLVYVELLSRRDRQWHIQGSGLHINLRYISYLATNVLTKRINHGFLFPLWPWLIFFWSKGRGPWPNAAPTLNTSLRDSIYKLLHIFVSTGYNSFRELCGLSRAKGFHELVDLPAEVIQRLSKLYA